MLRLKGALASTMLSLCALLLALSVASGERIAIKIVTGTPNPTPTPAGAARPVPRREPREVSGPSSLAHLAGRCFSHSQGTYTYELCLYRNVTQRETHGGYGAWYGILGLWSEWLPATGTPSTYHQQKYDDGTDCPNTKRRFMHVAVTCGTEYKLSNAREPATCEYSIDLACPEACAKDALLATPIGTTIASTTPSSASSNPSATVSKTAASTTPSVSATQASSVAAVKASVSSTGVSSAVAPSSPLPSVLTAPATNATAVEGLSCAPDASSTNDVQLLREQLARIEAKLDALLTVSSSPSSDNKLNVTIGEVVATASASERRNETTARGVAMEPGPLTDLKLELEGAVRPAPG